MNELSYVLWLPEDLHVKLKTYSAQHRETMRETAVKAIAKYISEDFKIESRDDPSEPNSNSAQ